MQLDIFTASVFSAFIGAGVAGLIQILTRWIDQRSEERRQVREIVFKNAVENWKQATEFSERQVAKGHRAIFLPLDAYVIHMTKLVQILNERNLTPELARNRVREVSAVSQAASDEIGQQTDEYRAKRGQPPIPN